MATISFNNPPPVTKPATEATPVEVEATPVVSTELPTDKAEVSNAIAVIEPKPLAVATPQVAEGISGEVSASDIKLPRINLVQKSGKLPDSFQPGSIVFEKAVVLSDGKTPIDVTPIRLKKQFQQKLEWGTEEQPLVFDTSAEVRAVGGSLQWGDENYYEEIAHIQVAVKLPESIDGDEFIDLFPYTFNDGLYALAIWTVASSSYTSFAKPIITASAGLLRNGLYTGHYSVVTEGKHNSKNSWFVPKPTFAGRHTPEAAEFFKSIAGL
jgi:hypothetical protein